MEGETGRINNHTTLRFDEEFFGFHKDGYRPYDLQKKYIRTVKRALKGNSNAIIESPTGTGKSLCLLYSTISWLKSNEGVKAQEAISRNLTCAGDKIQIIFCSRTHSQLMQVENELKKIYFEPTMAIFASRDYLCINENLDDFSSSEKNKGCTSMKTQYKKNLKRANPPPVRNIECGYFKPLGENEIALKPKKAPDDWKKEVYDIEEVKEMGLKHDFCPYYLPYRLMNVANIVFMPYNYLLFEDMVDNYKDLIKNSIIIFDEAHNVPSAACEGRTFSLKYSTLTKFMKQLNELREAKYESQELYVTREEFSREMIEVLKLTSIFMKELKIRFLEDKINLENQNEEIQQYSLKFNEICQFLTKIFGTTVSQNQNLSKCMDNLCLAFEDNPKLSSKGIKKISTFFQKLIKLWLNYLIEAEESDIKHYILCVYVKKSFILEIKMACLSPHLAFKTLESYSPRSFIITSGTLGNFNFWRTGLGIPFICELENDPIIDKENVVLNYVTTGKSKREFSFTQANRESNIPFEDLYHFLYFLGDEIPFGGILVLFPSSKVMKAFIEILEKNDKEKWNQLNAKRQIFTEKKVKKHRKFKQKKKNNQNDESESNDESVSSEEEGQEDDKLLKAADATDKEKQDSIQEQLQKYKDFIHEGNKANEENKRNKGNAENKGNKAFLFCYCYGNFSEGLDLRDDECRAVVVVGIPRINYKDIIVEGKQQYLEKIREKIPKGSKGKYQNGKEWFNNIVMTAVNQGIGRVVRHINDYGMIFLVDREFREYYFKNLISNWAKRNTKIINSHEDLQKEGIKEFFLRRRNAQEQNDI